MDRSELIHAVSADIVKSRNKQLTKQELQYISTQIKKLDSKFVAKYTFSNLVPVLKNLLIHDLQKSRVVSPEPDELDMHEMLKTAISQQPVHHSAIIQQPSTFKLPAVEYINLDRRYCNNTTDNTSIFSWDLGTTVSIKNIISVRMLPFRFPVTQYALNNINRISCTIDELAQQSYVSTEDARRFHFLFDVNVLGLGLPYNLTELGSKPAIFAFGNHINELNSVTLTFGNPFQRLTLDPDRLPATISSIGAQTRLTYAQPHLCSVGNVVYISGFNTTLPSADVSQISQMNNKFGWPITAITSTTQDIDVDISALTGAIINNPYQIYLDAKRFAIQLEFTTAAQ